VGHDERAPRQGEEAGRERGMRLVDPWAMLLEGLLREPAAGEDAAADRDGERE
jgi:hypothetical protein